ncbi:MAG: lysophospholipase [Thermomicrobiales bacterium]
MADLRVQQQRFILPSVTGGLLAGASWVPADPRAIVIVIHGHAEHLGRYQLLVMQLAANGYAVFGLDHHGHGRSSGVRGFARRFDAFVDDLETLVLRARTTCPGVPVIVFGHSMGGLIAVRYALRHNDDLAALVVSGPALIIDEGVRNSERTALELLARVRPAAGIPSSGEDKLSSNPEISAQFGIDHRTNHGPTRAATAIGMLEAGIDARSRAGSLTLPLLILHGAEDTLTYPSGSLQLLEAAASPDKTYETLPGLKHEILNEASRHETVARILTWMGERIG